MATSIIIAQQSTRQPKHDKINQSVIKQIKSLLAVDITIGLSNKDMTTTQQEESIFQNYHGGNDRVSQIDQFLEGKGLYRSMWEKEDTTSGPRSIIPSSLHRQHGKSIVKGGNMNHLVLSNTYAHQDGVLTGRTLKGYARDAIRDAKKILSLMPHAVKDNVVVKVGDEYDYCSGKNENDLVDYLLLRIYNWDKLFGATGKGEVSGE